jgi:hypothetical protein
MKITGEVVQVIEGALLQTYRIAQNGDYDNMYLVIYKRPEGESRVLEDDTVTVYGVCSGDYTYESTLGANITVPAIMAFAIDIIKYFSRRQSRFEIAFFLSYSFPAIT